MAQKTSKTSADVLIGGKVYSLSGYEGEAYLQMLASYLNGKIDEMADLRKGRRFPEDMRAVLLELNLADDYFKAKEHGEKTEQDLEDRNAEVLKLKNELVALQMKLDEFEQLVEELEEENKELLLRNTKLETTLEDVQKGIPNQVQESQITQIQSNQSRSNQGYRSVKGRN